MQFVSHNWLSQYSQTLIEISRFAMTGHCSENSPRKERKQYGCVNFVLSATYASPFASPCPPAATSFDFRTHPRLHHRETRNPTLSVLGNAQAESCSRGCNPSGVTTRRLVYFRRFVPRRDSPPPFPHPDTQIIPNMIPMFEFSSFSDLGVPQKINILVALSTKPNAEHTEESLQRSCLY